MPDIFISYSQKDKPFVKKLAHALESVGYDTWWDADLIAGQDWREMIHQQLEASKCVIVVWSANSVTRHWVLGEATEAMQRDILVPIRMDNTKIPIPFNALQTDDFTKWKGDTTDTTFLRLLSALSKHVKPSFPPERPPEPLPPDAKKLPLGMLSSAVLAGLVVWFVMKPDTPQPVQIRSDTPQPAQIKPDTLQPVRQQAQIKPDTLQPVRQQAQIKPDTPQPIQPQAQIKPQSVPIQEPTYQDFEPEMVTIPAGTFTMGCVAGRDDVGDLSCDNDEKPSRKVNVAAFQLAKTEVTIAQFKAFIDATSYQTTAEKKGSCWVYDGGWKDKKGYSWRKVGFKQEDDHPVTCISWEDAQAYVQWLKQKTGKAYRLPSEAEWEYAVRAGSETTYSWGNLAGHEYANYGKDGCCAGLAKGKDKWQYTSPVASFPANAYGLYDMHGNVWEWVQDKWHDDYQGALSTASPWQTGTSSDRVLRGGSWSYDPQFLRSANRNYGTLDDRNNHVGFRPALDL